MAWRYDSYIIARWWLYQLYHVMSLSLLLKSPLFWQTQHISWCFQSHNGCSGQAETRYQHFTQFQRICQCSDALPGRLGKKSGAGELCCVIPLLQPKKRKRFMCSFIFICLYVLSIYIHFYPFLSIHSIFERNHILMGKAIAPKLLPPAGLHPETWGIP